MVFAILMLIFSVQMADSSAIATGMVDTDKAIVPEGTSSEITQQAINNEMSVDRVLSSSVNGEVDAIGEEISSAGDHTSAGLPLSKTAVSHKPTTQPPSDVTAQASMPSPMDTTVESPLLTTTPVTTGTSEISTKDINSQSTSDVHVSASVPSMNDTSTNTMKTSIQTGIANMGADNTCIDGSTMEEKISQSLSTAHNVTVATANAGSSLVTRPANTAVGCSAELTTSACNVPKLEPSTLGKVKMGPRDFDNITFPKPILPVTSASGYNSSKVAAEMAKIDSFLASLAKGGTSSNTMPNIKVKTETAGVLKPVPVGSALGNIALSYGYSEEESSSSSSDESEDDKPASVQSAKMTATAAVVAMDTREVEQSMKKVAVSSDSSSSSSEDELG